MQNYNVKVCLRIENFILSKLQLFLLKVVSNSTTFNKEQFIYSGSLFK